VKEFIKHHKLQIVATVTLKQRLMTRRNTEVLQLNVMEDIKEREINLTQENTEKLEF
jgi:hypothetical protein